MLWREARAGSSRLPQFLFLPPSALAEGALAASPGTVKAAGDAWGAGSGPGAAELGSWGLGHPGRLRELSTAGCSAWLPGKPWPTLSLPGHVPCLRAGKVGPTVYGKGRGSWGLSEEGLGWREPVAPGDSAPASPSAESWALWPGRPGLSPVLGRTPPCVSGCSSCSAGPGGLPVLSPAACGLPTPQILLRVHTDRPEDTSLPQAPFRTLKSPRGRPPSPKCLLSVGAGAGSGASEVEVTVRKVGDPGFQLPGVRPSAPPPPQGGQPGPSAPLRP